MLLNQFLLLGAVLFSIGVYGVLARRNGVHGADVGRADPQRGQHQPRRLRRLHGTVAGQVFALFVIAIAAAEVGVGLAIVLLHLPQPSQHRPRRARRDEGLRRDCT